MRKRADRVVLPDSEHDPRGRGRSILPDLDNCIQSIGREQPDHPAALQLTGIYHNLLRRWADV